MKKHPAEVFPPLSFVQEELESRGADETWLRQYLTEDELADLHDGKMDYPIACGLAQAFGTSVDLWLNLQKSWEAGLAIALEEEAKKQTQEAP